MKIIFNKKLKYIIFLYSKRKALLVHKRKQKNKLLTQCQLTLKLE